MLLGCHLCATGKTDAYLALAGLVILSATVALNMKEIALLTRNMWSLQVVLIAASAMLSKAPPCDSIRVPNEVHGPTGAPQESCRVV